MQGLAELINHRLKFMANFKENVTKSSQQIMFMLLKQKKRQLSNEGVEGALIKTLIQTKISAPYQIQQFYDKSYYLMRIYDKNFNIKIPSEEQNIYDRIVKTYVKFFINQDSQLRAEEVIHLYTKKICSKHLLLPTMFNWFADWARKTFKQFLKKQLSKQQSTKKLQLTIQKRNSLLIPHSQNKSINLLPKIDPESISREKNNQSTLLPRSPKEFDKNQYINSLKSIQYQRLKLSKAESQEWPKEEGLIVNRQVYLGAFVDQTQLYYKQFNIISDLDCNFPRILKRNDRKEEFKSKFAEVAGVLSKYQGQCKKSIDFYYKNYSDRIEVQLKNIQRKINHRKFSGISDSKIDKNQKLNERMQRLKSIERLQNDHKQKEFPQFESLKHQTLQIRPQDCIHRQPKIILAGQIKLLKSDRKLHPIRNNREVSYVNIQVEIEKQIKEMNKIFGRASEEKNNQKLYDRIQIDRQSPKFPFRNLNQKKQHSFSIGNSQQGMKVRELDDFMVQSKEQSEGIFYFPRIKQ